MTEEQVQVDQVPETKPLGTGSMIVKIFSEPSAVFKSIRTKPNWVVPFILVILLAAVAGYVGAPYGVDLQEQWLQHSESMSPQIRSMIETQIEASRANPTATAIKGGVSQMVTSAIFAFLFAGLYMLIGSVILGGSARFTRVLSVAIWGAFPMILGSLIKLPLMVAKGSADVRTSLAILLPGKSMFDTTVAVLNGLTDVFTLWTLIIEIIGISLIYQFSKGKAAAVVLIPFLLLMAIGIGISRLFV